MNAANTFKIVDTSGLERRFSDNSARNSNLIILPNVSNGTCTNQNLFWRTKHMKFTMILI